MNIQHHPDYSFTIENLDLHPNRFYLLFYPLFGANDTEEFHDLYYINYSNQHYLFDSNMMIQDRVLWQERGLISDLALNFISRIPCYWLNDKPRFSVELTEKTTTGTGQSKSSELLLKPKTYLKKTASLNEKEYVYLFELPPFATKKTTSIPKENMLKIKKKPRKAKEEKTWGHYAIIGMSDTLDLHTEQLSIDTTGLSSGEILRMQLKTFEEYLQKAFLANLDSVHIIHGIGKGKLKEEIHRKLKLIPEVRGFKNEYHPKFGWGATKIVLK